MPGNIKITFDTLFDCLLKFFDTYNLHLFSDSSNLKWKDNLAVKAQEAFLRRQKDTPNLRKLVYGDSKFADCFSSN